MTANQAVFIPEQLYGIIGSPLGHSLSPLLHNWGFQHHGLNAAYCRWPTPPGGLPEFIAATRALPITGVSVTIPHKRTIIPYLEGLTADAQRAGAVNTLFWVENQLWGENTDVQGFLTPLEAQPEQIRSALVLGVGGASRAVLWGLQRFGVAEIMVCGRNLDAALALADAAGCGWVAWEERRRWRGDLLVNATPLGMRGAFATHTPWPGELRGVRIVYDLVYNPTETCLLRQAACSGITAIGGLEMFIAQAQGQFRLWTQKELPAESVRELLASTLTAQE